VARQRKPKVIETIKDEKTGDTCDLLLDQNTLTFRAVYQGETCSHETASVVREWIVRTLKETRAIQWESGDQNRSRTSD
jgi:hypothetical protein